MDQLVLKAATRAESGKKVAKKLRGNGSLPAVMYNSKGEAVMLTVDEDAFTKVWKVATPTTLVNLDVDGKKNLVFIKDTQYDIISDKNLHVDFHAIDEDKLLKISIKMQVAGNPVGVRDGGYLAKGIPSIEIECLPKNLPVRIVADVNNLGLGEKLLVKDVPVGKGVKLISDGEAVVATINSITLQE